MNFFKKITHYIIGIIIAIVIFFKSMIKEGVEHPKSLLNATEEGGRLIYSSERQTIKLLNNLNKYSEYENLFKNRSSLETEKFVLENGDHFELIRKLKEYNDLSDDLIEEVENSHSNLNSKYSYCIDPNRTFSIKTSIGKTYLNNLIEERIKASIRTNKEILNKFGKKNLDNEKLENSCFIFQKNEKLFKNDKLLEISKLNETDKVFSSLKISKKNLRKIFSTKVKLLFNVNKIPKHKVIPELIYIIEKNEPIELVNSFKNAKFGNVVKSKLELISIIKKLKNEYKTPILIFNNKNGMIYNQNINKYNVENVITCNSYTLKKSNNLIMNTIDKINVNEIVTSLDNIYGKYIDDFNEINYLIRGENIGSNKLFRHTIIKNIILSNPGKTIFLDDFYLECFKEYNKLLVRKNKNEVIAISGITGFTIGGCSSIIYIVNKNKK